MEPKACRLVRTHLAHEKFLSSPAVYADAIPFLTGPEGVGLEKALAGYAEWIKKVWLPGWGSCKHTYGYTNDNTDVSCFNTYNASNPVFTDTSLGKFAQSPASGGVLWELASDIH